MVPIILSDVNVGTTLEPFNISITLTSNLESFGVLLILHLVGVRGVDSFDGVFSFHKMLLGRLVWVEMMIRSTH